MQEAISGTPSVSIVIPTKNAGEPFSATLAAILRQRGPAAELLVVDSGSADGTAARAREAGARVIEIPPESFNHGETRNLGIREASGQICVLLVQDATPRGETWLEQLIAPFENPAVAGAWGSQVARPDSDAFGRWEVAYHRRVMGEKLQVHAVRDWSQFLGLPFEERVRRAGLNNVTSAVRRSVWGRMAFRPLNFGEDLDWGVRALAAGHSLVYNPAAAVLHSHSRPASYGLRRQYVSCKTVPALVHMPVEDLRIPDDETLFGLIAGVCREAEYMLREPMTGLQQIWDFGCGFGLRRGLAKQAWSALVRGSEQPLLNSDALREPFFDHLGQAAPFVSDAGPESYHCLIVGALARAIGTVAGFYVRWCEQQGRVSENLRRLDKALGQGV